MTTRTLPPSLLSDDCGCASDLCAVCTPLCTRCSTRPALRALPRIGLCGECAIVMLHEFVQVTRGDVRNVEGGAS